MPPRTTEPKTVLTSRAVERTLRRMADEIVELNDGTDDLVLVGIQRRGVQLAERIVRADRGAREARRSRAARSTSPSIATTCRPSARGRWSARPTLPWTSTASTS